MKSSAAALVSALGVHDHQVGRAPVADPLGTEQVQRVPDRLRPRGLPRVRHAAQAGRPRGVEASAACGQLAIG